MRPFLVRGRRHVETDYRPWLRRELARHEQPCWCMDCSSARGELLFLGEELPCPAPTVEQVVRRAM